MYLYNSIPENAVTMNNEHVDFLNEVKFLGILLDNKTKFDKHINMICKKISRSIGILCRLRSLVPLQCLRLLYFSLIHPYILYCLPIFGKACATHMKPLIVLQKRAIRIINNAEYLAHTDPLFRTSKILKVYDQYNHSVGTYVYRNQDLLVNFTRNHHYNTRNRNSYLAPRERLRSTERSVLYNAVCIWNTIPEDIKNSLSVASFKYTGCFF